MDKKIGLDDALAILNPKTSAAKLAEYEYYGGFKGKDAVEKAVYTARMLACQAIRFKQFFDDLYGKGLEVTNWHLNGDTEPLDNFIESANTVKTDMEEKENE